MDYKKIVDILIEELTDNTVLFARNEVNLVMLANNLINTYCRRYGGIRFIKLMLGHGFSKSDLSELGFTDEYIEMAIETKEIK